MYRLKITNEMQDLMNIKLKRAKQLEDLIYESSPLKAEKAELEKLYKEIDFIAEEAKYEFEEASEY
jgi:hypothetical protein